MERIGVIFTVIELEFRFSSKMWVSNVEQGPVDSSVLSHSALDFPVKMISAK